ncbi:MAG: Maf family protein [Pseudomonadota bacterium]
MRLILASQSSARRAVLDAAGVTFEAMAPMVDEDGAKAALRADGISPRDLADALAELKARKLSQRFPADLVLGCDQTLSLDDGTMFDKPESLTALKAQLTILSGKTHNLWSAAVLAQGGTAIWRYVERCKMTIRPLSESFIDQYIEAEGDVLLGCVGGYRIEGFGIQLFNHIEATHFGILGLPLIPLLDILRIRGVIPS